MMESTTKNKDAAAVNSHYFKISWIQKIKVYKTQAHFFVVGSNYADTKFRLLKIRRTDPWELVIIDDGVEYNHQQMCDILEALLGGTSAPLLGKSSKRFAPKYTGYGIIGFVRFVEGYYLILATKQSKVADIGGNVVYKIEDTAMIYIPNNNVKINHADEWRYMKAFQTVDLSSHFYFSYSYDLTNSLQHNMLLLQSKHASANRSDENARDADVQSDGSTGESWVYVTENELAAMKEQDESNAKESKPSKMTSHPKRTAVASHPCDRFLWNKYLLEPLEFECVSELWSIKIVHGHISQACVNVYGKPIYITLIGRRSCRYAGPRFMKRGCNVNGDVANEVETEQIVHCASATSLHHSQFTSYIQHRGSVPVHWSQDITASVVPAKPPIVLSLDNPYSQATARHFEAMMQRYGSPIMVLNLVRKKEKRFRESVLGQEFKLALDYLNQFLSAEHQIKYFAFDMAHLSRNSNVLTRLAEMANYTLQATGIFQSKPQLFKSSHDKDPRWRQLGGQFLEGFRIQTGVLRTNCVDCLDRTNSAQFVAGKSALAYQFFSLGVLSEPNLNFDTDVTRMYEEMFDQHGDIIALQYGGSQLVHTIQTYRRTIAPWASHSRDIVTTLSRYYSNTFSDADKQSAINLFLGVFKPHPTQDPLWELSTDYYLHNHDIDILKSFSTHNYLRWWRPQVIGCLPLPFDTMLVIGSNRRATDDDPCHVTYKQLIKQSEDSSDWFSNFHRVQELTSFDDCLSLQISNTLNSCISYGYADLSPFTVRGENWQHLKHERLQPDSTTSQSSLDVSSNESSDSDDNVVDGKHAPLHYDVTVDTQTNNVLPWLKPPTIDEFSPQNLYGIDIEHATSAQDEKTYRRYVDYEELLADQGPYVNELADSNIKLPAVDQQSMLIYVDSVSHKYHVDAEFYRDYFRQFDAD